jgi:DNA-binding NtrC family response regulator
MARRESTPFLIPDPILKSLLYLGCPAADRINDERTLRSAGVSVVWAESVGHALVELQRHDLPVLLDVCRGSAPLHLARELRNHRDSTVMFAVVDPRRPELTTEAVLLGVADVFSRPLGAKRVANAIERQLHRESGAPTAPAAGDELYAHSPAMRDVMALVARASTMRAGVLIRGERGTGRRATARAIHAGEGGRRPFVAVDCASCNHDDVESHLFGGGARTSPHGDGTDRSIERVSRNGLLVAAAGGTLYLQNIADAPSRVQARLARVLRDREATLVETGAAINLDVRPVAGVEPAFEMAIAEGRVREDLLRRVSLIRIDVPPLRNRREDIPALANYFLRDVCAALKVPARTFSRAALSLMAALPWRGNAAELRGLIESIVSSAHDARSIRLDDVLAHVKLDGGSVAFTGGGTLRQARARFEREYISAALEQHHGRISDAAKALGVQRTNLYRKMRSLRVMRARP